MFVCAGGIEQDTRDEADGGHQREHQDGGADEEAMRLLLATLRPGQAVTRTMEIRGPHSPGKTTEETARKSKRSKKSKKSKDKDKDKDKVKEKPKESSSKNQGQYIS